MVGLSEDEFYKPRFGIVWNLDVSEGAMGWLAREESGRRT